MRDFLQKIWKYILSFFLGTALASTVAVVIDDPKHTAFKDDVAEAIVTIIISEQDINFTSKGEYISSIPCSKPEVISGFKTCITHYVTTEEKGWMVHMDNGKIKQTIDYGFLGRDSIYIYPPPYINSTSTP